MANETEYQVEEPTTVKGLWSKRWVRVTSVTVVAALALGGSFGVGVLAGEKIGSSQANSHANPFGKFGPDSNHLGTGNWGNGSWGNGQSGTGSSQQFNGYGGPGQGINGGFPGPCPANDPDHCAGTDRNQHDFQAPGGSSAGSETTNGTASTNS
jgi:hypothetical protein